MQEVKYLAVDFCNISLDCDFEERDFGQFVNDAYVFDDSSLILELIDRLSDHR